MLNLKAKLQFAYMQRSAALENCLQNSKVVHIITGIKLSKHNCDISSSSTKYCILLGVKFYKERDSLQPSQFTLLVNVGH